MSLHATVEFYAPSDELDLIDLAARVVGISRGEFLLHSAAERAHEVLLDGAELEVDEEASRHTIELAEAARMVC
ncbi:MAG TPA: DUF1778 domain-containing protein [Methylibium sp.]